MKFQKRIKKLIEEKGFLIATHRGLWGGNIIQNTKESAILAHSSGSDIVEIDVCKTKDNEYFLFHDGHEEELLHRNISFSEMTSNEILKSAAYNSIGQSSGYKINRLDEFLSWLPVDILVNLDRCWEYFNDTEFWDVLKKSEKMEQVFVKSPVNSSVLENLVHFGSNIPYMAIIKEEKDYELVTQYKNSINLIGVEVVFTDKDSSQLNNKYLKPLREQNELIMFNSINLGEEHNLSAMIVDDDAILNDGSQWYTLLKMGANVIQTDWPHFCSDFRRRLNE